MEMDGGNAQGKGENWSIYRDAFTPTSLSHTTTKPKPRPWERAPVSAHAPRLAGQKIWKKASSLHPTASQTLNADKENAVQVDLELEKGGMGARKRRRGVGGKENIAEARWKAVDAEGVERAVDGGTAEGKLGASPKKIGGGLRDEDAFVVPRKRTNANHLITPRKPLRSIENHVVAPVLQVEQSPVKGTKIPLNDREGGERADTEERPRRRKSMRKSRRLTRSDLVEESVEERRGSFVFGEKGGDVGLESFSGVAVTVDGAGTQSEESSDVQDASSVLEQAAITLPVEAAESQDTVSTELETDTIQSATQQAVQILEEEETVENEISKHPEEQVFVPQEIDSGLEAKTEEVSNGVNENLATQSELEPIVDLSTAQDVELATIEEQPIQAAAESINLRPTTIESTELQTISEQKPQTPLKAVQFQPTAPLSTEPNMAIVLSPTKSVATPRSRRKTHQRSATRRSTRTSRSSRTSSVPREEPSAQPVSDQEGMALETADAMSGAEIHVVASTTLDLDITVSPEVERASQDENVEEVHEIPAASLPEDEQFMDNFTINEAVHTMETVTDAMEAQPEDENIPTGETVYETSADMGPERKDEAERGSLEQESCDEQLRQEFEISTPKHKSLPAVSPSPSSEPVQEVPSSEEISEESAESFELIEPMSIATSENAPCSPTDEGSEELHESSTPDLITTELTETVSENAPSAVYDHDDTDMLRNFLSKVKANKAAKAKTSIPKRKRSLPHSPLQIPLGTVDAQSSPSSPKAKDEFDVSLPTASPSKRRKRNEPAREAPQEEEDTTEPRSIRRSGRTRLPVKTAPAAPSFIPVRRLGQDGDSTVTLRRNEEKELAALTKVNTRKNKGGASHPAEVLAKKADEKEDPASRQRALKEVFDEKNYKQKLNKKGKSVVWAEELAQFQTEEGKKVVVVALAPEKEGKKEGKRVMIAEKEPEREKEKPILPGDEKKSASASSTPKVKVGMRSKMTLGMAANGTPAPKRRVRGRA